DAMVLLNGRLSVLRIAFKLARQRGIRVLVHERPRSSSTLFVVENDICTSPVPFKRFWQAWAEVPLTHEQLVEVVQWIRDRRHSRHQTDLPAATSPKGANKIANALGLAQGRQIFALFTTSTDEFAGDPDRQGPFPSQELWIERVVEWVAKHPECDMVIRVHPSLSGKTGAGYARTQIEWFQALQVRLPRNVKLVLPDDLLSSYDLMDIADVGLTYGSTAGLEMFALGKPLVLVPSFAIYDDVPGIALIRNPEEVDSTLDKTLTLKPSREFRRYAFRCIYRYYF